MLNAPAEAAARSARPIDRVAPTKGAAAEAAAPAARRVAEATALLTAEPRRLNAAMPLPTEAPVEWAAPITARSAERAPVAKARSPWRALRDTTATART